MGGAGSVILGASGFIGTRLVRRLHTRGEPVRALDILPPRERHDGVDYQLADVREPIAPEFGAGASILYNFAAVHRTPGHPDHEYYETNVAGALNATALAEACDIRTIVFTSSISVYGPCEQAVDEASPLRPVSSYGRSKRLAERIHRDWLERGEGRRLVIVRPGVVFGPGEVGNYTRLARALKGRYFFFPGRRDTVKSGGYVDELLSTMAFALSRNERSILYNFAYPQPSTTEAIVDSLGRIVGRPSRPLTLPIAPLLAAATVFEAANALGIKNTIHRDRVMKLVQSTRITPGWLVSSGYEFQSNLESALNQWNDETNGRFD
jgi:nucleoside-diphosphate-sugar epimerase